MSKILGRLAWALFAVLILALAGLSAYNYLFSPARPTDKWSDGYE